MSLRVSEQKKTRMSVFAPALTLTLVFVVPAGETSNPFSAFSESGQAFFEDLALCQAALKSLPTPPIIDPVTPEKIK